MEEPNPNAVYAQVDMALKRKNRRNSTSKGGREETGRKRPGPPPQRPPPIPPVAYTGKKTNPPPPVATKKPSLTEQANRATSEHNHLPSSSPSLKPQTLPKPPTIPKKVSQVLAEKKRKIVPPKPIPYHIYIKAKEKRLLNGSSSGPGRTGKEKENRPSHRDSDSSNDS